MSRFSRRGFATYLLAGICGLVTTRFNRSSVKNVVLPETLCNRLQVVVDKTLPMLMKEQAQRLCRTTPYTYGEITNIQNRLFIAQTHTKLEILAKTEEIIEIMAFIRCQDNNSCRTYQ